MKDGTLTLFDFSRIADAHSRLSLHIVRTPLLNRPMLDEVAGCELFVKSESLQKTNSFKFRGALNMILQLPPEKLKIGVVAYSSGNHGQGVVAARLAGTPAVIVLPSNAAAVKLESCRWWSATIVTYNQATESRHTVAQRYIEAGMTLIPPFDDHAIIAGQGTAGLEMCEQFIERGVNPKSSSRPAVAEVWQLASSRPCTTISPMRNFMYRRATTKWDPHCLVVCGSKTSTRQETSWMP